MPDIVKLFMEASDGPKMARVTVMLLEVTEIELVPIPAPLTVKFPIPASNSNEPLLIKPSVNVLLAFGESKSVGLVSVTTISERL